MEQTQLEAAWRRISPPNDWRDEIHAIIPINWFGECQVACIHYTATELRAVRLLEDTQEVEVRAIGYRYGPAGP